MKTRPIKNLILASLSLSLTCVYAEMKLENPLKIEESINHLNEKVKTHVLLDTQKELSDKEEAAIAKAEQKIIAEAKAKKEKAIAAAEAIKVKAIAEAIRAKTMIEVEAIKAQATAEIEAKSATEIRIAKMRAKIAKEKILAATKDARLKAEFAFKNSTAALEPKQVPSAIKEDKKQKSVLKKNDKNVQVAFNKELDENLIKEFQLKNIGFKRNKSSLTDKGTESVRHLSEVLKKYPNINIEIAGYTDSDGSSKHNVELSQARVDGIKKLLISYGIAENRLIATGYGEEYPLVPNTTYKNKQKNRRIEINIIKK